MATKKQLETLRRDLDLRIATAATAFKALDGLRVDGQTKAFKARELTTALESLYRENEALKAEEDRAARVTAELRRMGGNPDANVETRDLSAATVGSKGVRAGRPTDLDENAWRDAYEAVVRKKSFRAEVATKAPTTIGLPPVMVPGLTQALPYEPDRLFDHLSVMSVDAPIVEYISHTGNANPAAVVAELGVKPDLGMALTTKTATMTKIAALASMSMEALTDFTTFSMFVPSELTRAVIDAETQFVATQLIGTSGILTRTQGTSEAPLDTLLEAFNDLRVGAAFCEPNLVAMHPNTWTMLRSQKDNYGRYLLNPDPTSGQRPNLWGVPVITNTKITAGDVLVMDTSCVAGWTRMAMTIDSDNGLSGTNFSTNVVAFRAEERIAVGALKPAGINLVTMSSSAA